MRETCRKVFGAHIADQTEVWKMDPASEIHGIWKHSDCPGEVPLSRIPETLWHIHLSQVLVYRRSM